MAADAGPTPRPKSRWRHLTLKRTILAVVIALVLLSPFAICKFNAYIHDLLGDLYGQWWVADMIVDYMERHDGAWPRQWDDLEEAYEICVARKGKAFEFRELQSLVVVDFAADPKELAKAIDRGEEPPFRVIYLANGKTHHWRGKEPNTVIWRYLQERAKRGPVLGDKE